jgi:acyl-CoA thioesterase
MTDTEHADAALAARIVEHMQACGPAFAYLGMEILEAAPGHVRARMKVRREFLNSHGICHGGFIFALADSVFAFVSNAGNRKAVGANCNISYLRQAKEGDELIAEAREIHAQGRSRFYDIDVTDGAGHRVALMRATARLVEGTNLPG